MQRAIDKNPTYFPDVGGQLGPVGHHCKLSVVINGIQALQILDMVEKDPSLIYPGATELDVASMLKGRCSLMFVTDQDMADMWISTLFQVLPARCLLSLSPYNDSLQKNNRLANLVKSAMSGMVDYMLYIGDKYEQYEKRGDKCAGPAVVEGKTVLSVMT